MASATFRARVLGFLRRYPRLFGGAALLFLTSSSLGAGLAVGTWKAVCHDCPSIAQIHVWEPVQSTRILAHDGRLIAELFTERRTPVSITELPHHVPMAFVAIEDKRFFRHDGFDFVGTARAATNMVLRGRIAGGGSTLTQQLARNIFVEEVGFEKRFRRKLKELKVAQQLERAYTKEQILEAYLNQVNFDRGWYGIETAAQRYFGKPAKSLNPAEAALLAAVVNRPAYYSPFRNPDAARQRRDVVLTLMEQQGFIDDAQTWKKQPLPTRTADNEAGDLAPYFVEWVRTALDDRFGRDLYRRGYRIHTTLDLEMQRLAWKAMQRGWERIESQRGFRGKKYASATGAPSRGGQTTYLQGLFIALDPRTGEIKAMIGGRDFDDSKFNRAVQAKRQPGSSFKPLVFAAAVADGYTATHIVADSPIAEPQVDGTIWEPKNYDGRFRGPVTLREALKHSINTVAIRIAEDVGLETVAQTAHRLGIETPIPRVPSIAIGAADVIPLQVTEAYTAFATQGMRVPPRAMVRIEDARGRVLWEAPPPATRRVLDARVASVVLGMMQDVVDHGSGYPVRDPRVGALPHTVPAAGKTGTTNDNTDIWFIGFTPDLLATVWFGFDQPRSILPNAAGGVYAAPVWGEFMRSVYTGENPLRPIPSPWPMPAEMVQVNVDRRSGKLATEFCALEDVYTETYIPGSEPTEPCDIHDASGLLGAPVRSPRPDTTPQAER